MPTDNAFFDEEIRLQQATLFLTLTRESCALRKEREQSREQLDRLTKRITELESECRSSKAGAVASDSAPNLGIQGLQNDLNALKQDFAKKEVENDKAQTQLTVVLEDNVRLRREVAELQEKCSHEVIASAEERNDLQRALQEQEQSAREQLDILNRLVNSLQARLKSKDIMLQESQAELQRIRSAISDVNPCKEPTSAELAISGQSQDEVPPLGHQQLMERLNQQRLEIERLRHMNLNGIHLRDVEGQLSTQATYRSVCVGVDPSELAVAAPTNARPESISAHPARHRTSTADKTVEEPFDLAEHASPLPKRRQDILDGLPGIPVALPAGTEQIYFTKTMLSQILGGSMQGLVVRITGSAKPLAIRWQVDEYLCPKMDHNPWSPTSPGKHGYMQVGLGQDKARFNTPEIRHIFVGNGGRFKYSGKYEVSRVEPLSVDEWNTLPDKVRHEYSKTTSIKEKHQNHGTVAEIYNKYQDGQLLAPCILLKCIEFDLDFFDDLIATARGFTSLTMKASAVPKKRKDAPIADAVRGSSQIKKLKIIVPAPSTRRKSSRISSTQQIPTAGLVDNDSDDLSSLSSSSGIESE